MTGRTIAHYQILDKLGEGGMGVVYKARDTHLDRLVAIKVLPPEKVADPERKRRFVQEAKAASALSHPNIIHIYDIDQTDGIDFISMEFIAGKRLDRLIPRHGMPLSEALKCGVQIADALAAAHGAGIVHRDLKPGNVMVTDKSQVKVLDFGLAKLTETGESGEDPETRTIRDEEAPRTGEGRIMGTAAYMSPEQAQGKKVDARSDIFSFGSLLYEMVTGRRAFQGESVVSTLAAIIKENPLPPSRVVEGLPKEVERLIFRCLRKDPERRFQHIVDVKMALEELKEESDSGMLEPKGLAKPKPRRKLLWSVAAVAVVVLAVAGLRFLRSGTQTSETVLSAVPLTSYSGTEDSPSFSPDGTEVAFQWCREGPGKSCDIYVKQISVEPPSPLTDTPAIEYSPAWSPDGQTIAFLRKPSEAATRCTLVLKPKRGGHEQVLAELDLSGAQTVLAGPYLTWTPDSKWLVCPVPEAGQGIWSLYLFSVETGEKRKLTSPPGGVAGDTAPVFSPDGRILAFARQLTDFSTSDLHLLPLAGGYRSQGEPERVPLDGPYLYGATWTPDGKEIVFATGKGLWRMAASKPTAPRRLPFGPDDARAPAISRQGNRLAYSVERSDWNIWRIDLREPGGKPGVPVRFIASTLKDYCPAYSPDGKRIAFVSDRSGSEEIWVSDADGSNAMPLTSHLGGTAFGPAWSPDSQSIAFYARPGGTSDIYVISANGGKPRRLTTEPGNDHWPYWSHDGQWLYFASGRGGTAEIWKMPASVGRAVQITHNAKGADLPHESPDGKYVYYSKGWPFPQSVWRVPAEGGEGTKVLDAVHPMAMWTVGKEGIYFFTVPDKKGRSDLSIYEFATGKTRKILTIERPLGPFFAVSPDDRTILYTQVDEAGSDLMLVENFR